MTIEDTLACTAFAEAGEPCPIDTKKQPAPSAERGAGKQSLENDLACIAFLEEGAECPICTDKKK